MHTEARTPKAASAAKPSVPHQHPLATGKITIVDGTTYYEPSFAPRVKHPEFEIKLDLQTEAAFRVFQSTYDPVQKALYHLHCTLPILARDNPKVIQDILGIVNAKFEAFETELDAELERLKHLEKTDGAEHARRYSNPEPLCVVVITPAMSRYLGLISKMDEVIRSIDALWFAMRIHETDRNNRMMEWRNKITRFHRLLGTYHMRALGAANRREHAAAAEQQASSEPLNVEAGGRKRKTVTDPERPKAKKASRKKAAKASAGDSAEVGAPQVPANAPPAAVADPLPALVPASPEERLEPAVAVEA